MTDGGEERMNTNINFFLEEYGIVVNNGIILSFKNLAVFSGFTINSLHHSIDIYYNLV